MIREFKEFLVKQNALALAVAVILGAAIGKVVSALVDNVINPLLGMALPGGSWREARIVLSSTTDATGKVVENAIAYGVLLGAVVDFLIISLVTGWLGFSGVSAGAATISKVLFGIALVIFLVILVFGVILGVLVFD